MEEDLARLRAAKDAWVRACSGHTTLLLLMERLTGDSRGLREALLILQER